MSETFSRNRHFFLDVYDILHYNTLYPVNAWPILEHVECILLCVSESISSAREEKKRCFVWHFSCLTCCLPYYQYISEVCQSLSKVRVQDRHFFYKDFKKLKIDNRNVCCYSIDAGNAFKIVNWINKPIKVSQSFKQ